MTQKQTGFPTVESVRCGANESRLANGMNESNSTVGAPTAPAIKVCLLCDGSTGSIAGPCNRLSHSGGPERVALPTHVVRVARLKLVRCSTHHRARSTNPVVLAGSPAMRRDEETAAGLIARLRCSPHVRGKPALPCQLPRVHERASDALGVPGTPARARL